MTLAFKEKGNMIYLVGKSHNDIACSQYLASWHGIQESPAPWFDLETEFKVQQLVKELIELNLIRSAHDVSDGGLFITLLESSIPGGLGFDITTDAEIRKDAFLFGEAQGRVVISVPQSKETQFLDFMIRSGVSFSALGHVTKGELRIDDLSYGFVSDYKKNYDTSIEKHFS